MAGYYNMPEKTADAIDSDGWLHSGDLATMDAQGYVNIVGRLKDMVIRGGENLFPAEIEAFLIHHPKVADAQVLGIPDAFFGEELLAVVIPTGREAINEAETREHIQAEIEAFLIHHPKVADAQVLGIPDAFFGEELLAVVIPRAGEPLTEQELRDYCQGQISHQKIPRYFQFVDAYPLTASGKVQKFVLREQAINALGLEEVANVQTA